MSLKERMTQFAEGFQTMIVEIHTMAGDVSSGSFKSNRAESALKTGFRALHVSLDSIKPINRNRLFYPLADM
jgi:hypothetical protein